MSLELPFGVKLLNPGPVDHWYGPYADTAAANTAVPAVVREKKTVLVGTVEYWWRDGTADEDLIPKVAETEGGVNHWRGAYDPSSGAPPEEGGSGEEGEIQGGDEWVLSEAGELWGEYWPAKTIIKALVDNPGSDEENWRLI